MITTKRNFKCLRQAMTLVEILAVVVILGLLAVTLVVGLGGQLAQANHEIAKTQILRLVSGVGTYKTTKKKWPDNLSVLGEPNAAYSVPPAILKDPWGNNYQYQVPGADGHPYEIRSLGADGQPGGSGENADLSSISIQQGDDS